LQATGYQGCNQASAHRRVRWTQAEEFFFATAVDRLAVSPLTINTHERIVLTMGRRSLRDDILQAGMRVMFRSGYQGASVRDICAAAGAPQGSFTNHFRSKEAFAAEVLDRYFDYLKGLVRQALNDETLMPRQRLKRYLDIITGKLECDRWRIGCLIGDLSLEASSRSKCLRERLDAIFQEWRTPFASCIAAAQSAGEVDSKFDATELAEFLLASWEGAILRMKVERGPAALERFKRIVFETVLKPPGTDGTDSLTKPQRASSDCGPKSRRRSAKRGAEGGQPDFYYHPPKKRRSHAQNK
jgi:TetR/AcrR family transcriptional repressor of nem operon